MSTVEALTFKAKLAERAERYDDMGSLVKKLVERLDYNIDMEQRNLLSVAYKNAVATRRTSWRILSQIQEKELAKGLKHGAECVREYKAQLENEIMILSDDLLDLLEHILPRGLTPEARTFMLKMQGDYHRYIAELPTPRRADAIAAAEKAYEAAKQAAEELRPSHHVRLGLALNRAVFTYEVKGNRNEGLTILQNAYHTAANELGAVDDKNYRDSTIIMNLLKENQALWDKGSA